MKLNLFHQEKMNNFSIEPTIKIGGSAFQGHKINANQPLPYLLSREPTKVVSLTFWCQNNFISKKTGIKLIKKKLLIGFRLYGQWWVRHNPDCYDELIEYLGVEELAFNVDLD